MSRLMFVRMLVCVLVGAGLATAPAAAQTTWYVDDNAPNDPGPGDPLVSDPLEDGSAEHPFDAIQEGIDATVDGDTVLVLDGTYTGDGNRDLDFDGRLITVRSENGPDMCTIDCQGSAEDRHRGFHFHSGETADAVVEGFTVTNGFIDWSGGMWNQNSSPTVINCTFNGNVGGGMCHWEGGTTTVINCPFSGNHSGEGWRDLGRPADGAQLHSVGERPRRDRGRRLSDVQQRTGRLVR